MLFFCEIGTEEWNEPWSEFETCSVLPPFFSGWYSPFLISLAIPGGKITFLTAKLSRIATTRNKFVFFLCFCDADFPADARSNFRRCFQVGNSWSDSKPWTEIFRHWAGENCHRQYSVNHRKIASLKRITRLCLYSDIKTENIAKVRMPVS